MPITLFQLLLPGDDAGGLHPYKFTFRTRQEAERYAADHKAANPRSAGYTVSEVTTKSDLVYSGPDGIGGFSVWSNGTIVRGLAVREQVFGRVSPDTGEPYDFPCDRTIEINPGGLTSAATTFLKEVLGSDSARPDWLARVKDVQRTTVSPARSKPGGYAGSEVTRLSVTTLDGGRFFKWAVTEGYSEGYIFDIYDSSWEAFKSLERPGWLATECLECGAAYDAPGFVEPGEMGCDRCNSEQTAWRQHLVAAGVEGR